MVSFKNFPQNKHEGKVVYKDGIIDSIVYLAVNELEFVEFASVRGKVAKAKSIKVSKEKDGIHVEVTVKIHYTQSVTEMAFKIQETIRHNVEAMTEYHITAVNVNVVGVLFDENKPVEIPPQEATSLNA